MCIWLGGVSLGSFVCWHGWWIRWCQCNSRTISGSFFVNESFVVGGEKVLCVFNEQVAKLCNCVSIRFLPGVFSFETGSDRDASWLSEIALDLESSIASSDKFWVVLNNDNVWEDVAFLNRLALSKRELHRQWSSSSAFHKAWCFVLVETSSCVDDASEVFLCDKLDLHWICATFELNFLKAFSGCIDVECIRKILLPHICRGWKTLNSHSLFDERSRHDEVIAKRTLNIQTRLSRSFTWWVSSLFTLSTTAELCNFPIV